ncbi:MAG: natural resistance-associated macrophage protein metal ion transporter [Candidatus Peribacteria bacterium]|nr:natural resistance-associated macrophage protein metal ion transporter [Candidatus Peribacteria bacterium]
MAFHSGSEAAQKKSLEEVHGTVPVRFPRFWRRLFAFAGPAYIVSVGYMDPGNWATDIAGGSRFGYELLWVLLMSNIMALILQTLSARMGIVMGRDLAQACRETYSRSVSLALWLLCEVAIAACDLAEVIGTVIGLNLLFGLPLEIGIILTVFDTFLLLAIQKLGMRKMEAFILLLVVTVGACFFVEIIWSQPQWNGVLRGLLPSLSARPPFIFKDNGALYVAIGILGATVMPHNLYLHSALVQSRKIERTPEKMREACRFNLFDSFIALNAAFFVNAAILILAASAFYRHGQVVESIEQAYALLPQFLGASTASSLFAIALLSSGQSSTLTGTLAGQIVMEGFLHLRIQPWLRRLITRSIAVLPAMVTIYILGAHHLQDLLILSQVVLSLQLPFAIIPLIHITSDPRRMGNFASRQWLKIIAWLAAGIIIALNVYLVVSQIVSWSAALQAAGYSPLWIQLTAIPLAIACTCLLVWLLVQPIIAWRPSPSAVRSFPIQDTQAMMHGLTRPRYTKIGVAVENKPEDIQVLHHAVALAKSHHAELLIIHVVDGVGGQWYGKETSDRESQSDATYLDELVTALEKEQVRARGILRFGKPANELLQTIRDENIDFFILRSHGHGFWADRFLGHTIEIIRHKASIPVLAVR